MSKELEKRLLALELESASKRLFWVVVLTVFCTIFVILDLMAGAYLSAVILLVLGGLTISKFPQALDDVKKLKALSSETNSVTKNE